MATCTCGFTFLVSLVFPGKKIVPLPTCTLERLETYRERKPASFLILCLQNWKSCCLNFHLCRLREREGREAKETTYGMSSQTTKVCFIWFLYDLDLKHNNIISNYCVQILLLAERVLDRSNADIAVDHYHRYKVLSIIPESEGDTILLLVGYCHQMWKLAWNVRYGLSGGHWAHGKFGFWRVQIFYILGSYISWYVIYNFNNIGECLYVLLFANASASYQFVFVRFYHACRWLGGKGQWARSCLL